MTRRILITSKANQDLDDIFDFIAQKNPDIALQFFDVARETFNQLTKNPGMGAIYEVSKPELKGLRRWRVRKFDKYMIFHRYDDDFVEIVRIIYAGRDISAIFVE